MQLLIVGERNPCTIVERDAVELEHYHTPGPVSFDGGIAFGSTHLILQNSIVADNTVGNGYNPINCGATLGGGGGDMQYPVARVGGGSDAPVRPARRPRSSPIRRSAVSRTTVA